MRTIQATEAKTRLAEILRAVEQGESFSITRHGKTIAHLLPAAATNQDLRREALARFRKKKISWGKTHFSTEDILKARHEGHRA